MAKQLEIIVKITDACNARCAYCSAGSAPDGQRKLPREMAALLLRQADELIASGRVNRVRLLWHGGEPLLLGKPFFRDLAALFHTLAHRGTITHRLQTNLTLLDKEWIDVLEPLIGRDGLGTSLDPFDDVRQLGEGDGYRRRWLANLDLLDRAGWKTGCVYVLHRLGLPRAKDLYWFFRNLRDNSMLSLRVNPLLQVGRARGSSCEHLLLSPGDYGRFLIEITDVWLADHRRLILAPVRELLRAWRGGSVSSCDLAGRQGCVEGHLGIDPDGRVYNCGRAVDAAGLTFGRLGEVSLGECLQHASRQVLLAREDMLQSDRCGDCAYWRFCHGGCPYESHAESEQAHQPTLLCEDYRLFFDWLSKSVSGQRSAISDQPADAPGQHSPASSAGCPTSSGGGGAMIAPGGESAPSLVHHGLEGKAFLLNPEPRTLNPSDAQQAVHAAAASGTPVTLADLRSWSPGDLRSLADFFLHDADLVVPVEPFYSALVHLTSSRGAAQGTEPPAHSSLRRLYGEPVPARHTDLPCLTCEAFKFCRCFWLDPHALPEHCSAWREICRKMVNSLTP